MEKLFTNQTGNISDNANVIRASGQILTVHAWGVDFDTATLGVYLYAVGATPTLTADLTFTGNGIVNIQPAPGTQISAQLSSVGASTDVNLWIVGQGTD